MLKQPDNQKLPKKAAAAKIGRPPRVFIAFDGPQGHEDRLAALQRPRRPPTRASAQLLMKTNVHLGSFGLFRLGSSDQNRAVLFGSLVTTLCKIV
jgi:hypothetical protein